MRLRRLPESKTKIKKKKLKEENLRRKGEDGNRQGRPSEGADTSRPTLKKEKGSKSSALTKRIRGVENHEKDY